jgi:hypothetical protein
MNNFFRALIAGYGAKKLGGGCLGTVLVFIVIWVALGQCSMKERFNTHIKNKYRENHSVVHLSSMSEAELHRDNI